MICHSLFFKSWLLIPWILPTFVTVEFDVATPSHFFFVSSFPWLYIFVEDEWSKHWSNQNNIFFFECLWDSEERKKGRKKGLLPRNYSWLTDWSWLHSIVFQIFFCFTSTRIWPVSAMALCYKNILFQLRFLTE